MTTLGTDLSTLRHNISIVYIHVSYVKDHLKLVLKIEHVS